MNTGTLVTSLIIAAVFVVLIGFLIRQMMRGWMRKAQRQVETIGTLPPMPDTVGPAIIPATKGLYVGSTIAPVDADGADDAAAVPSTPSWLDRVVVGDLGFRSKAVLTRYPEGIMVQRTGATPIWIPDESITAIRRVWGHAGKVVPRGRAVGPGGRAQAGDSILAIRWKLPSGTEIDTGFRGDDRNELDNWVEEDAA